MVAIAQKEKLYTIEEYFDMEERSEVKHEFHDGKIIPMAGGTHLHNEIAVNVAAALLQLVKSLSKKYKLYNSDMKIQIPEFHSFVYPDAVVICEKPEFWEGRRDVIVNPLLVVEVASTSTEEYDRNLKFHKYRTLPSFKEYVLVSQDSHYITAMFREEEDLWRTSDARGIEKSIQLHAIGCKLDLATVYEDVEFENEQVPDEK
jgi:Uma2 family endonuclease